MAIRSKLRTQPRPDVRRTEWVAIAFQFYAPVLAVILPIPHAIRDRVLIVNLAVLLIYVVLIRLNSGRERLVYTVIRDWLPLALTLLAYREMGWFAHPTPAHALELRWVVWDRAVLRGGARAAIEFLGPVLPSLLEIAYALVYTLAPFSVAVLYLYHHQERVDRFAFIFVLAVLLCYGQLPLWPSEPPRAVFFGQDFPTYNTVFRRFNWWLLGHYGIHTGVFPSAHVAGAFSTAFGMWLALPEHRWVTRFLIVMAVLIAVATVYGRYHYLADAAAGLAMAVIALGVHLILARHRPAHPSSQLS